MSTIMRRIRHVSTMHIRIACVVMGLLIIAVGAFPGTREGAYMALAGIALIIVSLGGPGLVRAITPHHHTPR